MDKSFDKNDENCKKISSIFLLYKSFSAVYNQPVVNQKQGCSKISVDIEEISIMEFNRIIKLLRKERGITQKQAAEDLGVSQALLSH